MPTRSVQVRDELSHRIDRGVLPAGSRLPSEPALATEFGVSRATLRDALRALESEGLIRRMWGSGTFVTTGRRLGVPKGEQMLAIWQVDYTEEGTAVLSSYEYHLANAFEFTVLRRGPGRRS